MARDPTEIAEKIAQFVREISRLRGEIRALECAPVLNGDGEVVSYADYTS
jgi:hypothetical protein